MLRFVVTIDIVLFGCIIVYLILINSLIVVSNANVTQFPETKFKCCTENNDFKTLKKSMLK